MVPALANFSFSTSNSDSSHGIEPRRCSAIGLSANGRALIPFPLNRGVWGKRGSRIINHRKKTNEANGFQGKYDLWVTGTVSTRARRELAAMGIEVTENVDARIGFLDWTGAERLPTAKPGLPKQSVISPTH